MSIEILVNVAPRETRAAILENGVVQELHVERTSRRGLVSNLYKGRVSRVLPGMQAGVRGRSVSSAPRSCTPPTSPAQRLERHTGELGAPGETCRRVEDIRRLVNAGDDILVQVIKDPIGSKGARLTTFVALVYPRVIWCTCRVARRSGCRHASRMSSERTRLKTLITELVATGPGSGGGYIVRTAAQGVAPESVREDMTYLAKLWEHVRTRVAEVPPGSVVHEDLPLALRVLRDELARGVSRVLVDSAREYQRMREFASATFMPQRYASGIELYAGPRPIFDLNGVEEEIAKALDRKVPLKSGGHLRDRPDRGDDDLIDVNTGAYVGHRNLEETIFRTNLEAAVSIARQLRLRNLGGIIIIDFIDMRDEPHRRAVLSALERALAGDRAQTHIVSLSPLGLVEMRPASARARARNTCCAGPVQAARGAASSALRRRCATRFLERLCDRAGSLPVVSC